MFRAHSSTNIVKAYFKSRIRKNRTKYIAARGVKEDDIPQILLHQLLEARDETATEKSIKKLPGVLRYWKNLRSTIKRDRFEKHLRRYIHMYRTDCTWEVSTTNRYTITTYEAAVTARQRIKQGEVIKYLSGTLVPLTAEEMANLDLTQRNFSIVSSSRKKGDSIFLGPARFANHDCEANARLLTKGGESMEVVAMRNIDIGDEITVSYGNDYFGPTNMDCLCHTCERKARNGWTPRSVLVGDDSHNAGEKNYANSATSGGKRKRDAASSVSHSTPSGKKRKVSNSPSKLQQAWTPPDTSESEAIEEIHRDDNVATSATKTFLERFSPPKSTVSDDLSLQNARVSEGQKPRSHSLGSEAISKKRRLTDAAELQFQRPQKLQRIDKMTARLLGTLPTPSSTPTSETSRSQKDDEAPSASEQAEKEISVEEDDATITIKVEAMEHTKIEADSPGPVAEATDTTQPDIPTPEQETHPQAISTVTTTTITKIHNIEHGDDEAPVLPSIEEMSTTKVTVQPVPDSVRLPGDWFLTRRLLAQPHDRWIYCRNKDCGGFFVQPNGYQTRRECPRCERHSMLYGFAWPKTDPDPRKLLQRKGDKTAKTAYRRQGKQGKGSWVEGAGDEETRTLDHRTIHRFVYPDEERETTRKGLLEEAERVRDAGGDPSALLLRRGFSANGVVLGHSTESIDRDSFASGSLTPDDGSGVRRSRRFVAQRVYAAV